MHERNKFRIDLPSWLIVIGVIIIILIALAGFSYLGCYFAPKEGSSGLILITREQCFSLVSNILKTPLIIVDIIKGIFK